METLQILYVIDLIGTGVFAISGAVTAAEKRLDVFGIATVAFITALGGGTLRDVLMGATPVGWMNNLAYLTVIGVSLLLGYIFRNPVRRLRRTFFLFDTIGIAVFTVLGLQKALIIGIHPIISIMMGVVSAVFGGVIRDIVCNEIPLIFRKEIYATACLAGAAIFIMLRYMGLATDWNILLTIGVIITIRLIAVRFQLSLNFFEK